MNSLKFIPIAEAVALMSKDPNKKVGVAVISEDGAILSTGYNGFPRGVDDSCIRYNDRVMKLKLIAHAEANAIAQAARAGVKLKGSSMIVTALHPCSDYTSRYKRGVRLRNVD